MLEVVILTFKEMAPFVITATLIICALIAIKIKKEDILTIDGIFSVVGVGLGLLITSMNLIYSNNYLISLGPLLAITCLLYLRLRGKILERGADFNLNLNPNTLKAINIMYWVCISVALLSYHQAPPYHRPPIFFICISRTTYSRARFSLQEPLPNVAAFQCSADWEFLITSLEKPSPSFRESVD